MHAEDQWFLLPQGGDPAGPYTTSELLSVLPGRPDLASAHVNRAGTAEWLPLMAVPTLAAAFSPPAAGAPPLRAPPSTSTAGPSPGASPRAHPTPSAGSRKKALLAVAIALLLPGTGGLLFVLFGLRRPVELKQDSPAATVGSMVKVLAKGRLEQLNELADPLLARGESRELACAQEIRDANLCILQVLSRDRTTAGGRPMPDCSMKSSTCTCGDKGNAAAAGAPPFLQSITARLLTDLSLSPDSCEITDSVDLSTSSSPGGGPNELDTMMQNFERVTCDGANRKEKFARVTMKCRSHARPLGFLLHESDHKWRLLWLEHETAQDLGLTMQLQTPLLVAHKQEAAKREREEERKKQELNKGMK